MKKYRVFVTESYTFTRAIEVEADDECMAIDEAKNLTLDQEVDFEKLQYSSTDAWVDEEIDTEEEYKRDKKRCDWE